MNYGQEIVHIVKEHVWVAPMIFLMAVLIILSLITIFKRNRRIAELQKEVMRLQDIRHKLDVRTKKLKSHIANVASRIQDGLEYFCGVHGIKIVQIEVFDPRKVSGEMLSLGEEDSESCSADTNMTAEEEAELDELIFDDEDVLIQSKEGV